MPGRRHLTLAEAGSALRRGSQIEQYLGRFVAADGRPALRWLTAFSQGHGFALVEHAVEDIGDEDHLDVSTFPPLDDEEYVGEGRQILAADDPTLLLDQAATGGASPDRWVNFGLVQAEYSEDRRLR